PGSVPWLTEPGTWPRLLSPGSAARRAPRGAGLHNSGRRQRHDVLSLVAFLFELRDQFVCDVPGEEQDIFGLVFVEVRLFQHRDKCSRHVLANFERSLDFDNAVNNPVVETHVMNQRAGTRGGTDTVNAMSLFLDVA